MVVKCIEHMHITAELKTYWCTCLYLIVTCTDGVVVYMCPCILLSIVHATNYCLYVCQL